MRPIHRRIFVLSWVFSVSPLAAQTPVDVVRVTVSAEVRDNARADTLDAKAVALYSTPKSWLEAARLHRRAGQMRGNDPRAIESFRQSAWLYSATGDLGSARQMMEKAGTQATAVGDIMLAAASFNDAAIIALEDHRTDLVPALVRRTRQLAESSRISVAQRDSILARLGAQPVFASIR